MEISKKTGLPGTVGVHVSFCAVTLCTRKKGFHASTSCTITRRSSHYYEYIITLYQTTKFWI